MGNINFNKQKIFRKSINVFIVLMLSLFVLGTGLLISSNRNNNLNLIDNQTITNQVEAGGNMEEYPNYIRISISYGYWDPSSAAIPSYSGVGTVYAEWQYGGTQSQTITSSGGPGGAFYEVSAQMGLYMNATPASGYVFVGYTVYSNSGTDQNPVWDLYKSEASNPWLCMAAEELYYDLNLEYDSPELLIVARFDIAPVAHYYQLDIYPRSGAITFAWHIPGAGAGEWTADEYIESSPIWVCDSTPYLYYGGEGGAQISSITVTPPSGKVIDYVSFEDGTATILAPNGVLNNQLNKNYDGGCNTGIKFWWKDAPGVLTLTKNEHIASITYKIGDGSWVTVTDSTTVSVDINVTFRCYATGSVGYSTTYDAYDNCISQPMTSAGYTFSPIAISHYHQLDIWGRGSEITFSWIVPGAGPGQYTVIDREDSSNIWVLEGSPYFYYGEGGPVITTITAEKENYILDYTSMENGTASITVTDGVPEAQLNKNYDGGCDTIIKFWWSELASLSLIVNSHISSISVKIGNSDWNTVYASTVVSVRVDTTYYCYATAAEGYSTTYDAYDNCYSDIMTTAGDIFSPVALDSNYFAVNIRPNGGTLTFTFLGGQGSYTVTDLEEPSNIYVTYGSPYFYYGPSYELITSITAQKDGNYMLAELVMTESGSSVTVTNGIPDNKLSANYSENHNIQDYLSARWAQTATLTITKSLHISSLYYKIGTGEWRNSPTSMTITVPVATTFYIYAVPEEGYATTYNSQNNCFSAVMTTDGYTFTPTATLIQYTVRFCSNTPASTEVDQAFDFGESKALRTNTFAAPATGWSFNGWAESLTAATAGIITYTDGQVVSNLTEENGAIVYLYAIWSRDIRFVSGPSVSTSFITVIQYWNGASDVGANISAPIETQCNGIDNWTKLGWRNDTNADDRNYEFGQSFSPSSTINYAVYSRQVTYYSGINHQTETSVNQYYSSYGVYSVTNPTEAQCASIDSWTKLGWRDDTETSIANAGAFNVKNGSSANVFYAVYSRNLTINYAAPDKTGGSVPSATVAVQYYNSNGSVTSPSIILASQGSLSKNGYNFTGWDIGNAGSEYQWNVAVNNTNITRTATAQWEGIEYTITINDSIGTGSAINNSTYTTNANPQVRTLTLPSSNEYNFLGWQVSNTNGSGTPTFNASYETMTIPSNCYGNIVLTAQWQENKKLTIRFISLNASNSTPINVVIDGGSPIVLTAVTGSTEISRATNSNAVSVVISKANPNYDYYISINGMCTTNSLVNSIAYTWTPNANFTMDIHVAQRYTVNIALGQNVSQSNNNTYLIHGTGYQNAISAANGYSLVSNLQCNGANLQYNQKTINFTYNLTHITALTQPNELVCRYSLTIQKDSVDSNITVNVTITAEELNITAEFEAHLGYELPNDLTATNCQKTWNKNTGILQMTRITDDVHITGAAVEKSVTVTFHANGGSILSGADWTGSGNTATKTVTCDLTYGTLPTANRSHYNFVGWYTDSVNGSKVETSTVVTNTQNHDLYAHWTEYTYTISFNANGGAGNMASMEGVRYSQNVTLTENAFGREGFNFVGWNSNPNGNGAGYPDKASVSGLGTTDGAVVTLYAQWSSSPIILPEAGPFNATYLENGSWNINAATGGTGNYSYTITNYNTLTGITLNGTTLSGAPTSNAKTYYITIKVTDNESGAEQTRSYVFNVQKKAIDDPVKTNNNGYIYNGQSQTLEITYDSTLAMVSGNTATNYGNYTATITLNDKTNYKWKNAGENNATIDWSIEKYTLNISAYATSYQSENNIYTRQNYITGIGNETLDIRYTLANNVPDEYTFANNGFTVELLDNTGNVDNYQIGTVGNVVIDANAINAPVKSNNTYVYDGQTKIFEFTNYDEFKDYVNISYKFNNATIQEAINAGEYQVVITLDQNYRWSDNEENERTFTFEILKAKVAQEPSLNKTEFTYSGNTCSVEVENLAQYMAIKAGSETNGILAGDYTVTIEITDTNHCFGEDGSNVTEMNLEWTINKAAVDIPAYVDQNEFVYTGTEITLNFGEYNKNIIEITGNKATNANPDNQPYQATISFRDEYKDNYMWTTTNNSEPQIVTWTIAKAVIAKPQIDGEYAYTGQLQSVRFTQEINPTFINVLNGTTTDAGTTTVILELVDTDNCKWDDNEITAVQLEWTVAKAKITSVELVKSTLVYAGEPQTIQLKNSYINNTNIKDIVEFTTTSEIQGEDVDTYTAVVVIKQQYTNNYEFENEQVGIIEWTITPKVLAIPTMIDDVIEYNGGEQEVIISGYDDTTMKITGNNTGVVANTYRFAIELLDKNNYVWEDGTTDTQFYTWKIVKSNTALVVTLVAGGTVTAAGVATYSVIKVRKGKRRKKRFYNLEEE